MQRDITVLETPAVPESAIVQYVGNFSNVPLTVSQSPVAKSKPFLTAVNIPSSYSNPFSGLGHTLDYTSTKLNNQNKQKYISRQMLAEISQKRVDDAQRQAEIDQLNEPHESAIILSSKKN